MNDFILAILIFAAGLFSILASLKNWNFFFESARAYLFVKLFGRQGARVFYVLLGLLLIFLSYYISLGG